MTPLQTMAGHQARSQPGIIDLGSTRARSSSSGGAGRGLRHGSELDKSYSSQTIMRLNQQFRILSAMNLFGCRISKSDYSMR
jgi:hypothetical protein